MKGCGCLQTFRAAHVSMSFRFDHEVKKFASAEYFVELWNRELTYTW